MGGRGRRVGEFYGVKADRGWRSMAGPEDSAGGGGGRREADRELVIARLVDAIRAAWPIIEATRVGHEWKSGFAKPEGMSREAWGYQLRQCRRVLTVAFVVAGVEVPRWEGESEIVP